MRHFNCEYLANLSDRANITIASTVISHVGFRLAQLELILTYSKGQLHRGNGVMRNILPFMLQYIIRESVIFRKSTMTCLLKNRFFLVRCFFL